MMAKQAQAASQSTGDPVPSLVFCEIRNISSQASQCAKQYGMIGTVVFNHQHLDF
jgi:hypothetical protein